MASKKRRMQRQITRAVKDALSRPARRVTPAMMLTAPSGELPKSVVMAWRELWDATPGVRQENIANRTPMTEAEAREVELTARHDSPCRGRLPMCGDIGALAVYGTGELKAIDRRRCRVKSDNRFPYQQSPVGPI